MGGSLLRFNLDTKNHSDFVVLLAKVLKSGSMRWDFFDPWYNYTRLLSFRGFTYLSIMSLFSDFDIAQVHSMFLCTCTYLDYMAAQRIFPVPISGWSAPLCYLYHEHQKSGCLHAYKYVVLVCVILILMRLTDSVLYMYLCTLVVCK